MEDDFLPSIYETKLPNLANKDMKIQQAKERRYPKFLMKLHFLAYFCGSRGSGKTTAILQLIGKYIRTKSFDHIIIYSPTCRNEPKYKNLVETFPEARIELREKFTHDDFTQLRYDIDKRIETYKQYQKDLEMYKKYKNYKGRWEDFDDNSLLKLYDLDFEKPTTEYKYGMPTHLILFDDQQGNKDLYGTQGAKAAAMNSFFILHRHKLTSVIFSCQSFKGNAVPKSIRQNISCMCLWRNKSPEIQKEIAKECCALVHPQDFIEFWNHATNKSRHDFLFIDYEMEEPLNIRKNFNTLLSHKKINIKK